MIKVSVIIPAYNSSQYIEKCLNSVLNQTLKEIEIIVIDDGSKDDTKEKVLKLQTKANTKIKYFYQKNSGLGHARNTGIKQATGEYIAFVDSDDYIDNEMLEEMYSEAKKVDADIVECDFLWEYPNKTKIDKGREYKNIKDALTHMRVLACNKIYHRKFIQKTKSTFATSLRYEDVYFTYHYLPYIKKIAYLSKPFYHYVQRKTSLANHQTEKVRDIYKILDLVLTDYKKQNLYKLYKKELEYIYIRYLLGSSFLRAVKIKDNKLSKKVLKEGWIILNKTFPHWKKNPYLKEKGKKNLYYRYINYPLYRISAIINRRIHR